MNWEQALRQRLLDDLAVAAIAGGRIEWEIQPQGAQRPNVTLQLVSDSRPDNLAGVPAHRQSRVQFDCRAETKAAAAALREAVIAALRAPATSNSVTFGRGEVAGVRAFLETTETGTVYRDSIDLLLMHG